MTHIETKISDVVRAYDLGTIVSHKRLTGGIVNTTYDVTTTNGRNNSSGRYIIQELNRTSSSRMTRLYEQVQTKLRTQGVFVPFLVSTPDGASQQIHSNAIWRMFEYVPHEPVVSHALATYSAAKTLACYHNILKDESHIEPEIEHFHDSAQIKHTLLAHTPPSEVRSEITYLAQQSTELPQRKTTVLHGDPKLANFLFNEDRVVAMLDLDTVMSGNVLIDIGDALRSWCKNTKTQGTFTFDSALAKAIVGKYNANAGEHIVSLEDAFTAAKVITHELASRLIIDYCGDEKYFSFGLSSDEEQKCRLSRAQAYVHYAKSIHLD